jgi:GntR family transcriptional regulator
MTSGKPQNDMTESPLAPGPLASGMPASGTLGFRPLYRQAKDHFLKRLVDGDWPPGFGLPSEGQLASEIGVSQGTVRKALDELAAENLLVRRQGRGTFVAEHDETRIMFQFFKLTPDLGKARFPDSRLIRVASEKANADETQRLVLAEGAQVIRIRRLRQIDGQPVLVEDIALPEALFAGLAEAEIPNNLYALYAMAHGVTIASASERLKAVALEEQDAQALGVATGHPALLIDRVAIDLSGRPVEWRRSLCLTQAMHYLSELK